MLSREECLTILELGPKASGYEIENRYTMLIKRYRGETGAEAEKQLEQITLAYNILTGHYVEPEPVNPRLEKVVLGKSRKQWRNIWHYGRGTVLAILLGVSLVGYLIYTIATNEPPDFQVAAVGLINTSGDSDNRIADYVRTVFPDFNEIEFQALPINASEGSTDGGTTNDLANADAQSQYAFTMKMMVLTSADSIEVYICDQPVFNRYAPQGSFADLTALYERLQDLPPEILAKIKPLRRALADNSTEASGQTAETAGTTTSTEDAVNQDTSLPIYGLDVGELHLTEGLGLYCDHQILTVGYRAGSQADAEKFLEHLIRDYEKMHQLQRDSEAAATAAASAAAG